MSDVIHLDMVLILDKLSGNHSGGRSVMAGALPRAMPRENALRFVKIRAEGSDSVWNLISIMDTVDV